MDETGPAWPPAQVDGAGSTPRRCEPPRRRPSAAERWRPLLLRWHFYAGLLIGPFILIAAVTGTMYALIPQIDRAVYDHELTVDHIGDRVLPLGEQVQAARRAHPEGTITSVRPAPVPGETTRVQLNTDDVREGLTKTVFVDPYTAEVRGVLPTMGEWLPTRTWFDDLHRNLHLGAVGRNYSEIAASWLWVIALGGLVLWIGHRRRTRKLRRIAVPDRTGSRRARTLSWHGAVGVWIVVGLVALSASGLSWSRYAGGHIADLRSELSWTTPSVTTTGGAAAAGAGAEPASGQDPAGFTSAYASAQNAGLVGPMDITPPASSGQDWKVAENARGYPSHYDAIALDPQTFTVTDRVDFADWPLAAKLTEWAISAHMGLFGVVNQIALVLLGLGLITVIARGYLMWWRRRPRAGGLPGAPRRGGLGQLTTGEAVVLVGAIALTGWFLPWLGLPLGLFLLADVIHGSVAATRDRNTTT